MAKLELRIEADSPEDLLDAVRGLVPKGIVAYALNASSAGPRESDVLESFQNELSEARAADSSPQAPAPRRRRTKAEMEAANGPTGLSSSPDSPTGTASTTDPDAPASTADIGAQIKQVNAEVAAEGVITLAMAQDVMSRAIAHARAQGRNVSILKPIIEEATKTDANPAGFGGVRLMPPELLPRAVAALEAYMAT